MEFKNNLCQKKLTKKQEFELWGTDGPYSEVELKIQHRVLDDKISRVFIEVIANINPFTFKLIKKIESYFIMMQ